KDPVNRPILAIGGVMALVVLILVWASAANSGRYYAIEKKGALQIWKGEFSPTGKKIITVLPGVALPEPAKAVYGAAELYPLAFDYYMNRADALGNTQDVPDFDGIQTSLKAALSFSTTREMQRNVMDRLDTIDRTALTYKAAEAARLGTIEGLSAAISLLMESAQLTTDKAEKDIINQRIDAHHAAIAQIEAESANNQLDASDSSAETH
ncbi:hypothetical protein LJC71_10420, partial [Desulfosarcina sp. OttesenSCG-928-A07]|nr:hypothetical protein [Desulfosarcina sp. OttesenSCG-928-G17]MDL2330135.1 hypothetical protein [Desulfosarcina sp. OttesenSCG-928-A07]